MAYEEHYSTTEPTREELDSFSGPVIVEFGADWCPHCQAVAPRLSALFANHAGIRHVKIADGKGKRLGRSFRVKLWPTLIFMREGKLLYEVARPSDPELQEGFEKLLSTTA